MTDSRQTGSSDRGKGYLTLAHEPLAPAHGQVEVESGFFREFLFPAIFPPPLCPLACRTLRSKPQRESGWYTPAAVCTPQTTALRAACQTRRSSRVWWSTACIPFPLPTMHSWRAGPAASRCQPHVVRAQRWHGTSGVEWTDGRVGAKRRCVADAGQPEGFAIGETVCRSPPRGSHFAPRPLTAPTARV